MADVPYGGGTGVSIPPALYGNVIPFSRRSALPREAVVNALVEALKAPHVEKVLSGLAAGAEIPKSVVGQKVIDLPQSIRITHSYPHAFGTDMVRYGAEANYAQPWKKVSVAPFLHSEELARRLLFQEILKKGRAGSD